MNDEFKLFKEFLESKKQTQMLDDVATVKEELQRNTQALTEALKAEPQQFQLICNLKVQRDELKNILIELLEKNLAA